MARLYTQPFPLDADRDYDVAVTILRCEGGTASRGRIADFAAIIEITTAGAEPHVVARRTFVAPAAAWDGGNFAQLAALLSADVDALGQEIRGRRLPSCALKAFGTGGAH